MSMLGRMLFVFLFLTGVLGVSLHGQSMLKGRVIDEFSEEALPYASVYFNGTTNGATTDDNGRFEIEVDANFLELVVSYIGYKTIVHKLDVGDLGRNFAFKMSPLAESIREIEIKDKRGDRWYDNLRHFTEMFIGESELSRKTKIENPEVLSFSYDENTRIFEAHARGPIKISNDALGYDIEYDLQTFSHDYKTRKVIFVGFSRFIEKEGKKRKRKLWVKRRDKAYYGSFKHFLTSLHEQNAIEEGFRINRIVKSPNPRRPSEESIQEAKAIVKTIGYDGVPDSVRSIIKKSRRPKFVEYLDKNAHPYKDDVVNKSQYSLLKFSDTWQVMYDKEKGENNYARNGNRRNSGAVIEPQTSTIVMTAEQAKVLSIGLLENPLDILIEGYWASEKIGHMLPADYIPKEE